MESLPLLPGYNFTGEPPLLKDHKRCQKFKFLNGFPVCHDFRLCDDASCECGSEPGFDPDLTYGHKKRTCNHPRFQPHYVVYHQKILRFEAYFKTGIYNSPDEHCRVRRVFIYYYLEDDTMSIGEPKVPNCGFKQGKLVRRHRIPNPSKCGSYYSWKDLNVGIDLVIYGTVYRTTSCDDFTREFLNSQGVDVNESECVPADPYTVKQRVRRQNELPKPMTGPDLCEDARYMYLAFDQMLLFFKAMYEDNVNYQIYYYLSDNTIAVYEKLSRREGGKNMRILRRTKVPKNYRDLPPEYAGAFLEKSDAEIKEYYSPKDFMIGKTVFIFGRRLFLYDCDMFTRAYYCKYLGIEQPPAIHIENEENCPSVPQTRQEYPDEHKTDLVRLLYNFPRKLRYSAVLDTIRSEDENREFSVEYGLHDGSIRIIEQFKDNSGRRGGNFLDWNRVRKPGTKEFYTPLDFYIGAKLEIFGRFFVITGTDLYTYRYMLANPEKFPHDLKTNVREYMEKEGLLGDVDCFERKPEVEVPKEKPVAVCEVKGQPEQELDCCEKETKAEMPVCEEEEEKPPPDTPKSKCDEWREKMKEVTFQDVQCKKKSEEKPQSAPSDECSKSDCKEVLDGRECL